MRQVQLVVQPDDGPAPTLNAIRHATKTIDVTIFRLDRHDITAALEAAVARGVQVRALIAFFNRGGVHHLRRLEWRLLEAGVTVARSNDDFARYHAKLMIVDGRDLHVYGFNFTHADIDSRSFGIITPNRRLVRQAMGLFDADFAHRPYSASDGLVVSPENSRHRLEAFIQDARHELLIYDSKLGDRRVLRLLAERARAGVTVRVIGHMSKDAAPNGWHGPRRLDAHTGLNIRSIGDVGHAGGVRVARLHHRRMHLSAIVRDGTAAFVGSQGLRRSELDARREVGLFVHEPDVVREIQETFERDWPLDRAAAAESVDRVRHFR